MRQANEDDDLSLVEGDLIEHIVKLSDPWWAGFGPGGKRGFFPGEFIVVPSYFRCHGNSFAHATWRCLAANRVQLIGHSDDYMPGIAAIALHDYDVSTFFRLNSQSLLPCERSNRAVR